MIITRMARGGLRSLRHPIAWAAALLVLSCGNPTGVDLAPTLQVTAVVVEPGTSTVAIDAELPLHAVVMDGAGHTTSSASIVWSVRDPNIASVSTTGVVTGRTAGTTQVAASAGGKSGTATITVQPPPVASVAVSPASKGLAVGTTTTLAATVTDANGATVTDRVVTWSSNNTAVATVDATTGVVTAVAPGSATISASAGGKTGSST
ncbi:MAG: Ig-like domain-containing protein, partial [Gemmatimonadota bacterium]|nr:Ig-like domain-containing protein [Gemmatimonadota bacterium]